MNLLYSVIETLSLGGKLPQTKKINNSDMIGQKITIKGNKNVSDIR